METRVKKYKPYRKQIKKEYISLIKTNKNNKDLSKLESKLASIDKSLIKIEEIDLFTICIADEDEWLNYLIPIKEIVSFFNVSEISKILLLSQSPIKEINLNQEKNHKIAESILKDDPNFLKILAMNRRINKKNENENIYKREIKDLNNHIEKMLIDCKTVRHKEEEYIEGINKYSNDIKNNNRTKIFFIIVSIIFIIFLSLGIILLIIGII